MRKLTIVAALAATFAVSPSLAVNLDLESASLDVLDTQRMRLRGVRVIGDTFQTDWGWVSAENRWILLDLERQAWKVHNRLTEGRYWGATAVVANVLYTIGGAPGGPGIEAFDVETGNWSQVSPESPGFLVRAAAIGGRIYALGDDGTFQLFDPVANTFEPLPPAPTAEWVSEMEVYDERLYVFGGFLGLERSATPAVWEYDPLTGLWTERAPMPTARYGSAVALSNDEIFVFGGNFGSLVVEAYHPPTNTWRSVADLPFDLRGWDVAAPSGDRIIIVDSTVDGRVLVFDPSTELFAEVDDINTPRGQYTMGEAVNGRVYVLGGYGGNYDLSVRTRVESLAAEDVTQASEYRSDPNGVATGEREESYEAYALEHLARKRQLQQ
jgi:hypothetical protein